jgi:uncharacterized protein GlcG (DUF336 family)
MPNRSLATLSFACISVLTATNAHAQSLLYDKKDITGFAARKMIEACLAQAARDHYPIALAVVNSAGYLVSYQSTDGATGNTGVTAQLKAKTAAKFRRATGELYERVNKQINRAPEWMGYFPIPGGFPIVVQGEVVGAIGAGAAGLSGGRDEDCAQNAIESVFGDRKTVPPASPQPLLATRKVILRYKKRMGWSVPWFSSSGTDFNVDFGLTTDRGETFGLSVFLRDGRRVCRTYLTTRRGVEMLGSPWSFLDLTPFGRQETWEDSPEGWPQTPPYEWRRRHDEYNG